MHFTTAALAFAAATMAAPPKCTFGQYVCSKDGLSILQCNIAGSLVPIGPCPNGSRCSNIGDIPYCQAVRESKRDAPPSCTTPGTYTCTVDNKGINVCNLQKQVVLNGPCPAGSHCSYLNGIPFCVDNDIKGY